MLTSRSSRPWRSSTCSRMRAGASSSSRSTATKLARSLAEHGGQIAQALLAARDEHERGARLAREPPRGRLADAAGGAGDHGDQRRSLGAVSCCHDSARISVGGSVRARVLPIRRALSRFMSHDDSNASSESPSPIGHASARRWSCSAACRGATTCCRRRSASGRILAGAARWSRGGAAAGERVLDVATGTGMVAAELLARAGLLASWASTRARRCCPAPARASRARRRARRADRRAGGGAAVRRCELRRADVHLPAALRRGSGGDAARAGARRASRRADGLARVRRAAVAACARGVALYTAVGLPMLGRLASREWARGRALSRAEHPRLLRAPSAGADRRVLARPGSRVGCGA